MLRRHLVIGSLFLCVPVILPGLQRAFAAESRPSVSDEIRIEALRPSNDPIGRPLPLACSWTCGHYQSDRSGGWRPENQMRLIEEGHYLLPWFSHPEGEVPADPEAFLRRYYQGPVEKARRLNLPITFVGSQWESGLSREPYLGLPPDQNPNVVAIDGTIGKAVCPFGPVAPWREIGRKHTVICPTKASAANQTIQAIQASCHWCRTCFSARSRAASGSSDAPDSTVSQPR
jgi:hypothetical protein